MLFQHFFKLNYKFIIQLPIDILIIFCYFHRQHHSITVIKEYYNITKLYLNIPIGYAVQQPNNNLGIRRFELLNYNHQITILQYY